MGSIQNPKSKIQNCITLTQRKPPNFDAVVSLTLALTAEERTRSRHRFETEDGQVVFLRLSRGTVLRDGDILQDETDGSVIRIVAKPEPVITVFASTPLLLMRAAYHLGNRHVPVEITPGYLRLSPDSVLSTMLEHLGLEIKEEVAPFQPELGAYGHHSH
ncbi:urease accessory protein UreE [Nostoc sp. FACHB-152]|uniref:urease accessory protein UreE n=1 Tax=unclassified Nostoc TaxID=2593658 RepID=UPI0016851AE9|nr:MULTISPECIES: urease accessory protein UreE [unclassified Nostoc]MBD2451742.1 urease accessory protein UreE [Nostoc sp. FACHB-152]MBD2472329.1 urease accessory protein UreE [Nostoc sp. FACHB-145]